MVVSLNLNLSCAGPGEGLFLNLTTAPSFLTLVEGFAAEICAELIALIAQDGLMPTKLIGDGSTK